MFYIDPHGKIPIYRQIVNNIKENIMKKVLKPGDRIPSQRAMSKTLTANPNTVAKAYQELERQNVIETLQGKGTYVTREYNPVIDDEIIKNLDEKIKSIIIDMHYLGISMEEINKKFKKISSEMEVGI
jgi:GntR family transcriptional regulator